MVVFDATFLVLLLDPEVKSPVTGAKDRILYLLQKLENDGTPILVPTPALSELLIKAGRAAPEYVRILSNTKHFRIVPFDTVAAIEAAAAFERAIAGGDLREGLDSPRQKVKFDRQIVAIAKVHRATTIYTNDSDFDALVGQDGPEVVKLEELPLPPENVQMRLDLTDPPVEEPDETK